VSSLRPNDEHQEELPEETEVYNPMPYDRKEECREWHVERSGDMRDLIRDFTTEDRASVVSSGGIP
jgi:hypothetical protein